MMPTPTVAQQTAARFAALEAQNGLCLQGSMEDMSGADYALRAPSGDGSCSSQSASA
jgi:hypothetical protein